MEFAKERGKAGYESRGFARFQSSFEEGQLLTIEDWTVGVSFFEVNDTLVMRGRQSATKGNPEVPFLKVKEATKTKRLINGIEEELTLGNLPVGLLWRSFAIEVDDREAQRLELRAQGYDAFTVENIIASSPRKRDEFLKKNNWQMFWTYVWNDDEGKLATVLAEALPKPITNYSVGDTCGSRCDRLLAVIATVGALVAAKDRAADGQGYRRVGKVAGKREVWEGAVRTYFILSGIADEAIDKVIAAAEAAELSTVGRTTLA